MVIARAPSIRIAAVVAVVAACDAPDTAARIGLDQIAVVGQPALRTSPIGGVPSLNERRAREAVATELSYVHVGAGEAVVASYVLVDAANRSPLDAHVSLGGELVGADQTAPLRVESLFIPAGATRTFLLLDRGLAPRPWATGVKVVVTGAVHARHAPGFAIEDVHPMIDRLPDGDRVVVAARVRSTARRPGTVIVLAAFGDAAGAPMSRGHVVLYLRPGVPETVRFVGPPGSVTATVYPGESTF